MQIIISPAKKLNLNSTIPRDECQLPEFMAKANILAGIMKKFSSDDLQKLMNISKKVADTNVARYQNFDSKEEQTHPAIFTFAGEVYNGIKAETLSPSDLKYLTQHLSILSGLYGILNPLDLINPYRLEMGTKLKTNQGDNLYHYWKHDVTHNLQTKLDNDDNILINLASNEYYSVISKKLLSAKIITPIFKERKGDKLTTIMVYAKKARGLMSRFIIENKITNVAQIKEFTLENYRFSIENSAQSTNEEILTFIR